MRQAQTPGPQPRTPAKLATVTERDEEPPAATAASPFATVPKTPDHDPAAHMKSPPAKTPTTADQHFRPPHEEMHPSKVRQSTTKQADSGLILGFKPVKKDADGNVIKEGLAESTPTKTRGASPSNQLGTPGFEFKFASHETQLNEESQKFMESLRGEVGRVKAQMIANRNRQASDEERAARVQGDRRFAKPRSVAGRFDAAHMAQFKKMDSIAGHPSAFRATPGRFQPVNGSKSLKRTNSKAHLDDQSENNLTPSKSASVADKHARSPAASDDRAKRVKHTKTDDASTHRPVPTEGDSASTKPAIQHLRPAVRGPPRTPVRSSTARASSVKPARTSLIPSLARSPATKAFAAPRTPQTPQTEFNPKLRSDLPTLGNLKSILRRHQPLFSRDPAKIAAGTHAAAPDFNSTMLPRLVGDTSNITEIVQTPSPKKRVGFNLGAESRDEQPQPSPSPSKIPTAEGRTATSDIVYPTLPVLTPEKESKPATPVADNSKAPAVHPAQPSEAPDKSTPLQELPNVLHGIQNKKRRREDVDDKEDTENMPPAKSTPDARSTKKVKMAPASPAKPPTPSPIKTRPIAQARGIPGRATPGRTTPGRPTPVPAHSTPNKGATPGRAGTPASASAKGKPVLSLDRLNMLAKPKGR